MLDDILEEVNECLPQFNSHLLRDFKESQINNTIEFMKMTFTEATRLFNGKVQFKGVKILSPEDRISITLNNPRFTSTVEITQTDLMLVEFTFTYENSLFHIPLFMPYMKDDAIMINGSKYYIIFALTDRIFYHISKDNGLGIKVLRAHLRFWRNLRHTFTSLNGTRYGDHVIIVKSHLRNHKYTAEDIKTALILYPLAMHGWSSTLNRYGLTVNQLQFTNIWNKEDTTFEYFQIRKPENDKVGLYLKVDKSVLSSNPDAEMKIQMRVITGLMYVLQYFVRCPQTIYQDNKELVKYLSSDTDKTVWQVILGKTFYGINYSSETQVCSHAEQHLDSLQTYLDPNTKRDLQEVGVYCENISDLLDYFFVNMDQHIVNYTPANLYEKRINIVDLLFGPIVRRIFTKVYEYTNNNKSNRTSTIKEITSLFSIGSKAFTQLNSCTSVVAGNPAQYNDNYLLTVGMRKMRTTHSSTSAARGRGGASKQQTNHLSSAAHRYHDSWTVVESVMVVSHTHPDDAGAINPFCEIDHKGNIQIPDYAQDFGNIMQPYLITK